MMPESWRPASEYAEAIIAGIEELKAEIEPLSEAAPLARRWCPRVARPARSANYR